MNWEETQVHVCHSGWDAAAQLRPVDERHNEHESGSFFSFIRRPCRKQGDANIGKNDEVNSTLQRTTKMKSNFAFISLFNVVENSQVTYCKWPLPWFLSGTDSLQYQADHEW
jgi:hypothetical protein